MVGEEQPSLLFHLDQAMVVLSEGVVGVTRITASANDGVTSTGAPIPGIDEVELFLNRLRSQLSALDYQIVDILTTATLVSLRQYTANAIAYTDRTTGGKVMLMPVFPDGDRRIRTINKATFESLGYEVVPVQSTAFEQNGGIHCLINVLE